MPQANYFFYLLLFLGFVLPSNSTLSIPLAGVQLYIREFAFLLLPILNLFCYSKTTKKIVDKKLQTYILLFLGTVLITEILKAVFFGAGIEGVFKTIRIGLPYFSILVILFFGLRANISKVWNILLLAVSISAILTVLSIFVYIPIYPELEGSDVLISSGGRFINANASFGIIGIYLLYQGNSVWYNQGWLPFITSILSIIVLIISFNRTYLVIALLAVIYLTYTKYSLKNTIKYLSIPAFLLVAFLGAYSYSETVQRQVNSRIIDLVTGRTDIIENVYLNNRDQIVYGVADKISEGDWIFGLPYNEPIFYWQRITGVQPMAATDTSLVNVLLRYGIIPFILYGLIFYRLIKIRKNHLTLYLIVLYGIASINIDALFRHNSILFLTIIFYFYENKYVTKKRSKPMAEEPAVI